MARLEIEIGGSDKGGNAELQETLGLLEKLAQMKKGLTVDLFKAQTIDDIKTVGESLTSVNIKIGEYLGLASKATQAWKDERTSKILADLATKTDVAKTNIKAFGDSLRTQQTELRNYQTAFDNLIKNGLDRTDTEVMSLEGKIKSLTGTIAQTKTAIAEQKVFDTLGAKIKQIGLDTALAGDALKAGKAEIAAYQAAMNSLVKLGIDPASEKIRSLGTVISGLKAGLAASQGSGLVDPAALTVLDNMATKLSVIKTNAELFGSSLATQVSQLKTYQDAFNQLVAMGVDPAGAEMAELGNQIKNLTSEVEKSKAAMGEQKALDSLSTKLKQINNNVGLTGDSLQTARETIKAYQTAINNLIAAGVDPASDKIQRMKDTIQQLQTQMAQDTAKNLRDSFKETGFIVQDAQNKVARLQNMLNFATSEKQVAELNVALKKAQEELRRLGEVGLTTEQIMHRFGGKTSAAGIELARIVQDAPYAAQNFGSIGNNITRLMELWPTYISGVQAAVIANGQAATSANVLRASLAGLFTGANAWVLGISALVTAYTLWQQHSQKKQRELEKEKKKYQELGEQVDQFIRTLDAENKLRAEAASNYAREIASLNQLNATVMDSKTTKEQQIRAYEQLQKMYPAELGSLTMLEFQADKTSQAYKRLLENLQKVAYAEAAKELSANAVRDQVKATTALAAANSKLTNVNNSLAKAEERVRKAYAEFGTAYGNELYNDLVEPLRAQQKELRATVQTLGQAAGKAKTEFDVYNQAAKSANESIVEQTGLIHGLEKQISQLMAVRPFLKTEEDVRKNVKAVNDLQAEIVRLGGGSKAKGYSVGLTKVKTDTEDAIKTVKELGNTIKGIYNIETDSGNLIGLKALERANQATENKYRDLQDKVDQIEKESTQRYQNELKKRPELAQQINAQLAQIAKDATNERAEIEQGRVRELEANKTKYAEESIAKIAELEARAGKSRTASREQDLRDDMLYWDKVAQSAKEFNITAEQLTEWRKSSEAAINAKWDEKIMQDTIAYQRKTQESVNQIALRHLNARTKMAVREAKGDAQKLLQIQQGYYAKAAEIQERERSVNMVANFDGSIFSVLGEKVKKDMDELKLSIGGSREELAMFAEQMSQLQLQSQIIDLTRQSFEALSNGISTNLVDALFEGKSAAEALEDTFKGMAKTIIAQLIQIGVRYAINQALGVSSMAATVAASSAAGKAVAAAWASAAALASVATFGAAAATGGAALASVVAASKAMAMAGFKSGGYTGSMGRNKVAGVVHGQEFVVNANATKDYYPILKAMNEGRDITPLIPEKPRTGVMGTIRDSTTETAPVQVVGHIRNNIISLSNDRGQRFSKKFGRGK